jgi:hypothetical protein
VTIAAKFARRWGPACQTPLTRNPKVVIIAARAAAERMVATFPRPRYPVELGSAQHLIQEQTDISPRDAFKPLAFQLNSMILIN